MLNKSACLVFSQLYAVLLGCDDQTFPPRGSHTAMRAAPHVSRDGFHGGTFKHDKGVVAAMRRSLNILHLVVGSQCRAELS